ncbi:ATP-binding cassette domain-containing protein [Nocardia sp. CA2R105]|uniref:ATP-binding cassette domain-containing protein n=1 Tax=Nocardia coffeae TaxID=2873381 RepID=UPI001CA699CF|nr:ATP-binding cassette domain-containing protein [Nocardia coffeae]MBY8863713.1 ATP-binding cassette domain-containing protein [Nocardia coffeae]
MTAKSVEPPGDIPAVECVGLTHRYGEHTVVNDLDLRIERGEVFGLLGPNGAGKTTTIRLLTTLMPIQHGRVAMFGRQVGRDNTTIRYNLGYVPQQLSIEAALTGRQNVAWFARLFDVPRRERAERVEQVLAAMDLLDVADRLAAGYSGGMVRRLELAQALVNRPALLILDEPTVGLDPIARDSVWERVRELRHNFGTTVLLTTHYMSEADVLCDRIALLHKGILRAVGSPADLKAALGPQATLEDVFRHHAGAGLDEDSNTEGGLRGVRNTRRTAQRAG